MANYADDFESYGTGSGIPTGYTGRWDFTSAEWDRVTDTDIAVRHVETSIARAAVSYNAIDSDGTRANIDVLTRFKATVGIGSTLRGGVVVRGGGSSGTETGYTCGISGTELRIGKYNSGASTQPAITSGLALSETATYYWIRFRVQNTSSPVSLKAKIWTGLETDEPGTWTLDVSDSTSPITAAGWAGMFSFADGTKHWRDLAIATNGDVATMSSAPAAQTLTASLFTNSNTYYTHTLSAGVVALTAPLFTNTQTFYAVVLTSSGVVYRPISDITVAGWTATPSGAIYETIDEVSANDSDYTTSPDVSTPATFGTTTGAAGSFNVRIRANKTATTGQIRVRLLDGANVDVGGTAWQSLTTTPTTYTLPATVSATFERIKLELQA